MTGPDRRVALKQVAIVLLAFLVAALVVGIIWPHLVDPVEVVRDEAGLVTNELGLTDRFDNVGWYSLLAGAAGLLLGAVLTARSKADEVLTLVAILVGACLAAWLSARIGTWVGPDDPAKVLADAKLGDTAPDRVVLTADAAYLVWPVAALVGAVGVLLARLFVQEERDDKARADEDART
jgi:MFS family permease